MDKNEQRKAAHVAIVPSAGIGHLIPLVQLAKVLALQHGFSLTFIIPTDGSPTDAQNSIFQSLPQTVSSIFLPPVPLHDLPRDLQIETRIALTLSRSVPDLRRSLQLLHESTLLVAVVVDHFGVDFFEVAREFGVSPYLFFPTSAMVLSLAFELPKLDATVSGEFRDIPEPIKLPGCIPVHGIDLVEAVHRKNDAYKWLLHIFGKYHLAEGIMINSFTEIEAGALDAFKLDANKPPIYPIGPQIQTNPVGSGQGYDDSHCVRWLDQQPRGSVLFVSFGSGGTLSQHQLTELAYGLEMSGQRFLWVVKNPNDKSSATYFSVQSTEDEHPFDFLPKGFVDRTRGVGLVVPSWAPQVHVLSHASTAGFLSHCRWNSILESIAHGVPMIAWPLYAEQRMNAVLVADGLKVAMRVEEDNVGIVNRECVASNARRLLEGEEGRLLRSNMMALKESGAKALSKGGSSRKALEEVVQMWNNDHK